MTVLSSEQHTWQYAGIYLSKQTHQPSREQEKTIREGRRLHPGKRLGDCSERKKGERHMWHLHLIPVQNWNSESFCCTLAIYRYV